MELHFTLSNIDTLLAVGILAALISPTIPSPPRHWGIGVLILIRVLLG